MTLIIPDGFGQATLIFDFVTGPSNPMAVVFGYDNGNDQSPNGNAAIIRDEYQSNVLVSGHISDNVMLLGVVVLQNPGGSSALASSGNVGTDGGHALPPQVSYLVHKQTALGGREHRGRMYIPGPTIDQVTEGGTVDPEDLSSLGTAFEEFRFNLDSNSIPMVVLHSDALLAPTIVTNLEVDVLLATQRRRLRG